MLSDPPAPESSLTPTQQWMRAHFINKSAPFALVPTKDVLIASLIDVKDHVNTDLEPEKQKTEDRISNMATPISKAKKDIPNRTNAVVKTRPNTSDIANTNHSHSSYFKEAPMAPEQKTGLECFIGRETKEECEFNTRTGRYKNWGRNVASDKMGHETPVKKRKKKISGSVMMTSEEFWALKKV